jgi:hypothetical protein
MSLRNVVSTLALAACTLAPVASHAASLFGHGASTGTPATAPAVKAKMVKFTLANKTPVAMTVLVNDQPVTLAANSETPVRAAEGSDITDSDRSTVKVHVTGELSGNTVSFR